MRAPGFEVPARKTVEIWDLAEQLRAAIPLKSERFPLYRFAEILLPKMWPDFELTIGEVDELGEAHALTFPERAEICLREDVYEGLRAGHGRDRFTLAHEFGHLFMHGNAMARIRRQSTRATPLPLYMDSEWQADHYGGALLMPRDVVRKYPNPAILSAMCGVTEQAAQVRINYLKKYGFLQ